tara:strand:+ start:192 stop:569 length:378 start_codon:yes stop_codon:yes gene_type:complete
MNNVIDFPLSRRKKDIEKAKKRSKDIEREIYYMEEINYEDIMAITNYVTGEIYDMVNHNDFIPFEFKFLESKESREYKDMAVVVNLFTSALLRSKGIKHVFQEDLDAISLKIDYLGSEIETDDTT